jgi:hypothetical protein
MLRFSEFHEVSETKEKMVFRKSLREEYGFTIRMKDPSDGYEVVIISSQAKEILPNEIEKEFNYRVAEIGQIRIKTRVGSISLPSYWIEKCILTFQTQRKGTYERSHNQTFKR